MYDVYDSRVARRGQTDACRVSPALILWAQMSVVHVYAPVRWIKIVCSRSFRFAAPSPDLSMPPVHRYRMLRVRKHQPITSRVIPARPSFACRNRASFAVSSHHAATIAIKAKCETRMKKRRYKNPFEPQGAMTPSETPVVRRQHCEDIKDFLIPASQRHCSESRA